MFTPGIDGGGLYSLVVRARGTTPVKQSYRLQVAPSGADDGAPGIKLTNGQSVAGALFGRGIDVVDIYRLAVPHANELTTIDLQLKPNVGLDLLVLKEGGGRVTCACDGRGSQVLRENLPPAWYFLVVRSRDKSGGKYRLQVFVRDVTTTTIAVNGSSFVEVPPETSVPLAVQVTSASHGGPVQIEIDRRDLLFGWQFSSVVAGRVDAGGAFATDWTSTLGGSLARPGSIRRNAVQQPQRQRLRVRERHRTARVSGTDPDEGFEPVPLTVELRRLQSRRGHVLRSRALAS